MLRCTISTVTVNTGSSIEQLAETDTLGSINSTSKLPLQETVRCTSHLGVSQSRHDGLISLEIYFQPGRRAV